MDFPIATSLPHALLQPLRTHAEVQQWFRNHGVTIGEWSEKRGFNPALVYQVVRGNRKCIRGKSHEIAVELRLKITAADRT